MSVDLKPGVPMVHGDFFECSAVPLRPLLVQPWCSGCPDQHSPVNPGCPDDGRHDVVHRQVVAATDWYTLTVEQVDDPSEPQPRAVLLDVNMGNDLLPGEAAQLAADLMRADAALVAAGQCVSGQRGPLATVQN